MATLAAHPTASLSAAGALFFGIAWMCVGLGSLVASLISPIATTLLLFISLILACGTTAGAAVTALDTE